MTALKPQMGEQRFRFIENELLSFGKGRKKMNILEWGSGSSTVYFTKILHKHSIPFSWISLEHDPLWYEKVKKGLRNDASTSLVLFDVKGKNPRRKDVPMDDYVSYPSTLGTKFDLIIIDGRKRRRCLLEARNLVSKDGTVLLDDAFRPRYWCAFQEYRQWRFLSDGLWLGKLTEPTVICTARDLLNRWLYFTRYRLKWLRRGAISRLRKLAATFKNLNSAR